MGETRYRRLTYDLALAAGTMLSRLNPGMVFTYVSGEGTDSTEKGRVMWARVKGKTENDLARLPFAGVYLLRPGIIEPLDGIESKTPMYRTLYRWTRPLLPLAKRLFPNRILTTAEVGQAMLNLARKGAGRAIVETPDIVRWARGVPA
jgi:hypothetical protein